MFTLLNYEEEAYVMARQIKTHKQVVPVTETRQTEAEKQTQHKRLSVLEEARKKMSENNKNKRHPVGGKGL